VGIQSTPPKVRFTLGEVVGLQLGLGACEVVGLARHVTQNLLQVQVNRHWVLRRLILIFQHDFPAAINCPNDLKRTAHTVDRWFNCLEQCIVLQRSDTMG